MQILAWHAYCFILCSHLRHKNLVQLVGVVFQGSTIQSIVMELMAKGSLQKYLISRGRSVVSQPELLSFARYASATMQLVVHCEEVNYSM